MNIHERAAEFSEQYSATMRKRKQVDEVDLTNDDASNGLGTPSRVTKKRKTNGASSHMKEKTRQSVESICMSKGHASSKTMPVIDLTADDEEEVIASPKAKKKSKKSSQDEEKRLKRYAAHVLLMFVTSGSPSQVPQSATTIILQLL